MVRAARNTWRGSHRVVKCIGAACLFLGANAPALAQQASSDRFFAWTDTSVSALPYGDGFAVDPREQSTVTIEHAHASKIGDFFGFVDFTKFHGAPGGADSNTWYGE